MAAGTGTDGRDVGSARPPRTTQGGHPEVPMSPRPFGSTLAVQTPGKFPARARARAREGGVLAVSASLSASQPSGGVCA